MRICLVSDGLPPNCGGAPLRTLRHAERLRSTLDVGTTVIAWDKYGNQFPHDSLPDNVHSVRLKFQEASTNQNGNGAGNLALRLSELVARLGTLIFTIRKDFDLLHVINAASLFSLMTIPLAKLLNKPVILEMVQLGSDDPIKLNERSTSSEDQIFPHRPLKYTLFKQADAFVSKSNALSQAYRDAGLPVEKLRQIPNGVDANRFRPSTPGEKEDLRRKLGIEINGVIILFVGLINDRKGVRELVEAFRCVADDEPEARLVLVGPTLAPNADVLAAVEKSIAEWHLSEKVLLVNKLVKNVEDYMRAADIFCLPTKQEGFGVVIVEAMATGLPVIVSKLEGITPGIVQSEHEGILVPVGDLNALEVALRELIPSPGLRDKMGKAARRRVLHEFTDEIVDNQYMNLYRLVLNNRTPHS